MIEQMKIEFEEVKVQDEPKKTSDLKFIRKDYYMDVHIKTSKGGMQGISPGIVLTYGETTMSALRNRAINVLYVAKRSCSADEMDECGHPYRMSFLSYNNWDTFIEDEKKFPESVNEEWFKKLESLKQEYPQFTQKT